MQIDVIHQRAPEPARRRLPRDFLLQGIHRQIDFAAGHFLAHIVANLDQNVFDI